MRGQHVQALLKNLTNLAGPYAAVGRRSDLLQYLKSVPDNAFLSAAFRKTMPGVQYSSPLKKGFNSQVPDMGRFLKQVRELRRIRRPGALNVQKNYPKPPPGRWDSKAVKNLILRGL